MNRYFNLITILICLLAPLTARAVTYDIVIDAAGITFFPIPPHVGQPAKIYIAVKSVGTLDVEGVAVINDGTTLIGRKALSLKSGGKEEEIWTTWIPTTSGTHTIRVNIANDPGYPDATPENNFASRTILVEGDPEPSVVPIQPATSTKSATTASATTSTSRTTTTSTTVTQIPNTQGQKSIQPTPRITQKKPDSLATQINTTANQMTDDVTALLPTTIQPSSTASVPQNTPVSTPENTSTQSAAFERRQPFNFESALWIGAIVSAAAACIFFRGSRRRS